MNARAVQFNADTRRLLPRHVDEYYVRILLQAIEDDVLTVGRYIEAAQITFVPEPCDLSSLAGHEVEQPEVPRLGLRSIDEPLLIEKAIAAWTKAQSFARFR